MAHQGFYTEWIAKDDGKIRGRGNTPPLHYFYIHVTFKCQGAIPVRHLSVTKYLHFSDHLSPRFTFHLLVSGVPP